MPQTQLNKQFSIFYSFRLKNESCEPSSIHHLQLNILLSSSTPSKHQHSHLTHGVMYSWNINTTLDTNSFPSQYVYNSFHSFHSFHSFPLYFIPKHHKMNISVLTLSHHQYPQNISQQQMCTPFTPFNRNGTSAFHTNPSSIIQHHQH